jgi:hypothetical protein
MRGDIDKMGCVAVTKERAALQKNTVHADRGRSREKSKGKPLERFRSRTRRRSKDTEALR